MKIRKSLAMAGAVTTVGLSSIAGLGVASAQTGSNGADSLIEKISSKFNLNKDEVRVVFDENKAEREGEQQAKTSERLQDAVDDGDITAEQKTLIENKQKELQAAHKSERTELKAWAEQNNIDVKYLMVGHRGGNDDRLQDAVNDGDITAEQKTLIEQKQDELKNKIDAARDTLEQWNEDNDIDQKYLMMGGHGGHKGGLIGRF